MANFAEIDEQNKVTRVIVIDNLKLSKNGLQTEQNGIDFCRKIFGQNTNWVQTSYNASFRNKFAGIGDIWDPIQNVFKNA